MKKKFLSFFVTAALLITSAGCGGAADTSPDGSGANRVISGYSMSVNGSDGRMSITRSSGKNTPMGEDGTWTIFVYLCGTDLESGGKGFASGDLLQMLEGRTTDKVRYVVQTGGTKDWAVDSLNGSPVNRLLVENGDIQTVDSLPQANMGEGSTLADFLNWGIEEYPAARMGVILWDHGSGSIDGVCYDELFGEDSLTLPELNAALAEVYRNMTDKFEFIGFDACLMGTIETANILATYARYMYGSQEIEPGTGWNFAAIINFLADNPGAGGAELGKTVADSFYEECAERGKENGCTFTVADLEKLDNFTIAFNSYAEKLYEACVRGDNLGGVIRGITSVDNFGGNNKSEGYTNMVDLGGIITACSDIADGSEVLSALSDCVVYNRNGRDHPNATGLSIYYPLSVRGTTELQTFAEICTSPYYLSIVDMVAKGHTDHLYSNDAFFESDGSWSSDNMAEDLDYFLYTGSEGGEESGLITFDSVPNIDGGGSYSFTLDESGLEYAASVSAYVAMDIDENTMIQLGDTYDILGDWSTGEFADNFDGMWLALSDGQLLPTYIAGFGEDYVIYTSPVSLNGERTNLRIRQYGDYTVEIEGAWDGIDENGIAAREIRPLAAGDVIVPVYETLLMDSDDNGEYVGNEYTVVGGGDITYAYLPAADYFYGFSIDDVYGDFFLTDVVVFTVDEEGNITFTA